LLKINKNYAILNKTAESGLAQKQQIQISWAVLNNFARDGPQIPAERGFSQHLGRGEENEENLHIQNHYGINSNGGYMRPIKSRHHL